MLGWTTDGETLEKCMGESILREPAAVETLDGFDYAFSQKDYCDSYQWLTRSLWWYCMH
jgi:hypothetical protein